MFRLAPITVFLGVLGLGIGAFVCLYDGGGAAEVTDFPDWDACPEGMTVDVPDTAQVGSEIAVTGMIATPNGPYEIYLVDENATEENCCVCDSIVLTCLLEVEEMDIGSEQTVRPFHEEVDEEDVVEAEPSDSAQFSLRWGATPPVVADPCGFWIIWYGGSMPVLVP